MHNKPTEVTGTMALSKEESDKIDKLEKALDSGKYEASDELAKELHGLSKDDRRAAMQRIKAHEHQHPSAHLPKIEFYDDGELKDIVVKNGHNKYETTYDDAAKDKAKEIEKQSEKWTDGSITTETIYNPKTNKQRFYSTESNDGSYRTEIYYDDNERITQENEIDKKRGYSSTSVRDPVSDKMIRKHEEFKKGELGDPNLREIDTEYDPSKEKNGVGPVEKQVRKVDNDGSEDIYDYDIDGQGSYRKTHKNAPRPEKKK